MIASTDASILVAQHGTDNSTVECRLLPNKANRHGLITGATGTGKTITLQTMAEGFSRLGVPVFMADIKGDLTGISQGGSPSPKLSQIIKERGLPDPTYQAFPTTLWDVFGEQGHPVRATVSDLGPLLLSRMLNLNETQAGVLQLVFKIADDNGLLLLDMKDLRAMCQDVGDNASQYTTEYGNISAASIGAIQRGLMQIEAQGGAKFFGEPMLNIADFMQTDARGQGMVNILAADKLMNAPRLYATFLLWLLSELFETLPEVGDLDKPRAAQAGVLLRRGASVVQRRAQGAGGTHRAGGAPGAQQGRGRVFRHAKPAGHSRHGAGTTGQPRAARPARLHATRPEGRQVRRRYHAPQRGAGHWHRHYRIGGG